MKNVCFFSCDYQMGGANAVALNIANEFADRYNVHLVAAYDAIDASFDDRIHYTSFSLSQERILKMHSQVAFRFKRFIQEHDIDVVFAIGYFSAFFIAPFFYRRGKCRFVFCEHGAPANQLSDKKATIMRRLLVRCYDMTVALTHRSCEDFVNIIKAPKHKVTAIYNWIDEKSINDEHVYALSEKKILTVGRMTSEKGFDMLADIARDVFSRMPDWQWHIMGDGPDRAAFEKKIQEYGIEKNIVMHGTVSDASQYYGEYSIMALTSYREGLPLVLLEAKAKKLPCVSFDVVTGPSEIIRDGENGYLIPMYDKAMFADKLCELMRNDELRQSFSDKAMLDMEKFKKQTILSEWVALIERLSSERGEK